MVRLAGIEPTTPWFVAKYSIQLSYSRNSAVFYSPKNPVQTKKQLFCASHKKKAYCHERQQA